MISFLQARNFAMIMATLRETLMEKAENVYAVLLIVGKCYTEVDYIFLIKYV